MTAITLVRFDTQIVDLPTIRPHKLAMHTLHGQTLVILRIQSSDGIIGVGEATTIGGLAYAGESPESIKVNLDAWFAPLLIGQDATNLNAAMQRVDRAIRGNTFARSAVETALLDAQGKRLGLPVAEVLGGRVRAELQLTTARSVTEVALYHGFLHLGRFSEAYRKRFGELPSQTWRRQRRHVAPGG